MVHRVFLNETSRKKWHLSQLSGDVKVPSDNLVSPFQRHFPQAIF